MRVHTLPPRELTQLFLDRVRQANLKYQTAFHLWYRGMLQAQLARQSGGQLPGEPRSILRDLSHQLLCAARSAQQQNQLLAQEYQRVQGRIENAGTDHPNNLTVKWDQHGQVHAVELSASTVDVPPADLVLILKTKKFKPLWASDSFEQVFGFSIHGTEVHNPVTANVIRTNELSILKDGIANLYHEPLIVRRKKVCRWAVRFIADTNHIGVICWDVNCQLEIEPRTLINDMKYKAR